MDDFAAKIPSLDTMDKLNRVQLFLGATTMADITNKMRMHIYPWALTGSKKCKLLIPWPNQARPSDHCWVLWHSFLKKFYYPNTPALHCLKKTIKLSVKLGNWTSTKLYTARIYSFDKASGNVYVLHDNVFHKFAPTKNRVIWFTATPHTWNHLPDTARFATAIAFGSLL
eukprot:11098611-Ditylum_brightwellii.AAC.1